MIRRRNPMAAHPDTLRHLDQRRDQSVMIGALTARLADALALSLQARQAHWNVKGPSFQGLHELFDKVYTMASDHADLLAERVVQLGGTTNAVAAPVQSSLPAYPINAVMGREHAAAMTVSLIAYSEGLQRAAEQADEIGDAATLDIVSEALRGADKHRWFVESHLKGGMKFNGSKTESDFDFSDDPMYGAETRFRRLSSSLMNLSERIGTQMTRVAETWHKKHPGSTVTFIGDSHFGLPGFSVGGRDVMETPDDIRLKPLVEATVWFDDLYDQLRLDLGAFEIPAKPRSRRR